MASPATRTTGQLSISESDLWRISLLSCPLSHMKSVREAAFQVMNKWLFNERCAPLFHSLQKDEETYLRECSGDHQLRDGAKDAISYLDFQDVRLCSFGWQPVAACKRSWKLLTSLDHVLMEEALLVQS
jgi:hypothetical protein